MGLLLARTLLSASQGCTRYDQNTDTMEPNFKPVEIVFTFCTLSVNAKFFNLWYEQIQPFQKFGKFFLRKSEVKLP